MIILKKYLCTVTFKISIRFVCRLIFRTIIEWIPRDLELQENMINGFINVSITSQDFQLFKYEHEVFSNIIIIDLIII